MEIAIEYLKEADLPQYKELMDACFGSGNPLAHYEKHFDPHAHHYGIVVAKTGDKIVGSVTFYKIDLFTFSFQPALELFNVGVLEEYRGKQIAKKLLSFVFYLAKREGYRSVSLTCLDTARNAHKLYESVGFQKMSSIKYNMVLSGQNEE